MIIIADYWEKFSLWASTQPTFLQVALGVALFYVIFFIVRAIFKFVFFIISGLFSGRSHFGRRKTTKPQRQTKPITIDDEAPPFIFRWSPLSAIIILPALIPQIHIKPLTRLFKHSLHFEILQVRKKSSSCHLCVILLSVLTVKMTF